MGVPYSHLTQEEIERNLQFNAGRGARKMEGTNFMERTRKDIGDRLEKEGMKGRLEEGKPFKPFDVSGKWCTCNMGEESYTFYIPSLQFCVLCRVELDNDHYHCGACMRLSQIG